MKSLILRLVESRCGGAPVYLLLCLGLIAAGVALAFLPSTNLKMRDGTIETGDSYDSKERKEERQKLEEEKKQREAHWREISPHHWRVVGWVLECTNIKEIGKLPPYLREFFDPTNVGMAALETSPERLPHHHEMALVQISRAIADHRQTLLARVRSTYHDAQVASLVTVILGFITTIVVSFNSTSFGQGQGRTQQSMRFLAIFLTALGTAVSAVVAFYGPQDEWNETRRTLSALTSLHNVIGLETWKLNCLEFDEGTKQLKPDSKANSNVMLKFEEWTKRYYEIQNVSGPSGLSEKTNGLPKNSSVEKN